MKLTADTITDEQIRELRDALRADIGRLTPIQPGQRGSYDRMVKLNHESASCTVALGEKRARRGDSRRLARARCAEILNARAEGK